MGPWVVGQKQERNSERH